MDNNKKQDDIKEFIRINTKNDIKIEESINTVTDYYNKIQSLITKLDQLYQIELNTLRNILDSIKNKQIKFSTSHLTQVQTEIEKQYNAYKEQQDLNIQATLPKNYKKLKLNLYKDVYSTIMNFRTFLLGKGNAITYRIATKIQMEGNSSSFVQEITINEEDYLDTLRLDRSSMSSAIKGKNIQDILNIIENKDDEKRNVELSQAIIFSNTAKLRQSKLSKLYASGKYTVSEKKEYLQEVYDQYNTQRSKNIIPYRNQGSLYEIYVKIREDREKNQNINKLEDYLQESSGNIPFYKGGDYNNIQIKLFNASVATLDTMRRALNSIFEILKKYIEQSKKESNQERKKEIAQQLAQDLINFYTIKIPEGFEIEKKVQDSIDNIIGVVVQ